MKEYSLIAFLLLMTACGSVAEPQKFEPKIPKPQANNNAVALKTDGAPIVQFFDDGSVHLNKIKIGSVDDFDFLAELEKQIRAGFERRSREGAENPKIVFVRAPKSVKYGHVVKVTDKLKEIGAGPIGLAIDGLEE